MAVGNSHSGRVAVVAASGEMDQRDMPPAYSLPNGAASTSAAATASTSAAATAIATSTASSTNSTAPLSPSAFAFPAPTTRSSAHPPSARGWGKPTKQVVSTAPHCAEPLPPAVRRLAGLAAAERAASEVTDKGAQGVVAEAYAEMAREERAREERAREDVSREERAGGAIEETGEEEPEASAEDWRRRGGSGDWRVTGGGSAISSPMRPCYLLDNKPRETSQYAHERQERQYRRLQLQQRHEELQLHHQQRQREEQLRELHDEEQLRSFLHNPQQQESRPGASGITPCTVAPYGMGGPMSMGGQYHQYRSSESASMQRRLFELRVQAEREHAGEFELICPSDNAALQSVYEVLLQRSKRCVDEERQTPLR